MAAATTWSRLCHFFMLQHLSDREVRDITAWLRALPAVDNPQLAESHLTPATFKSLLDGTHPYATDDRPDTGNVPPRDRPVEPLALGKYLAYTTCSECHGRDLNGFEGDDAPSLVVAKAYSPEKFVRLMRTGEVAAGGKSKTGFMSEVAAYRFANTLTDAEIAALKLYLDSRQARGRRGALSSGAGPDRIDRMTASTPLLITFGIYLALMVGIGFVAWRRTRNFDDYILGGRSLGGYVTALSAGASDMSGWLLMGLPGALYLGGVSEAWIAIGLVIGAWANWRFVAGPLRVYTERTDNALTLPDYFTTRFAADGKLLRIVSAVVILVFFAIYAASGIVAGARLFESVFGLPYAQALWWGAAATVLYTLIGGFLAVSWTDTVQATLMIFALILTPIIVILSTGGVGDSLRVIEQVDPARLDWIGKGGMIGVVSAMAWGLGYFGQPHILARFMAADSLAVIPQARRIGMTWMILCLLGAIATGFFGISYFVQHPEQAGAVTSNPERVFIALSNLLFNPWIAGVLLSAILAAIMSTLSCQLLVCSSALTEDFYRGFVRPNAGERELVWVGRAMVLSVALIAIFIARDPDSRVLGLVSYAWAGFGAAFGPVVLFSLGWQRMTRSGALAGIAVGAITVIAWKLVAVQMLGSALYEMVPGVIMASIAIVVGSLLSPAPSQAVQARHQQVRLSLRESGY